QTMVRGTVEKVSPHEVAIKTSNGEVRVVLGKQFRVYSRVQGHLADVKNSRFVGVTSVKQSDGRQKATEIHIFPEELRGLGEGSHMMNPSPNPVPSRMTNGAVSHPRKSSHSRMSNGSIRRVGASTIVVNYRGGSQTILVPPGVTVTELKRTGSAIRPGERVVLMAHKGAKGELTA